MSAFIAARNTPDRLNDDAVSVLELAAMLLAFILGKKIALLEIKRIVIVCDFIYVTTDDMLYGFENSTGEFWTVFYDNAEKAVDNRLAFHLLNILRFLPNGVYGR